MYGASVAEIILLTLFYISGLMLLSLSHRILPSFCCSTGRIFQERFPSSGCRCVTHHSAVLAAWRTLVCGPRIVFRHFVWRRCVL